MKKETRNNIQVVSALLMLLGGYVLAVVGFFTPPRGEIHSSVLSLFAECLVYAGSIFGVTIYIQGKYSELRSFVEEKMGNTKEKGKTENAKIKNQE
jgi:4-amino-4-deoxy-L-arabinose transferase-like glycosyltransferase